jgi:hypothetical protein
MIVPVQEGFMQRALTWPGTASAPLSLSVQVCGIASLGPTNRKSVKYLMQNAERHFQ